MGIKYTESAQQLNQQKKRKMRVIKRRVELISATVLITAAIVGMANLHIDIWDTGDKANSSEGAKYGIENYAPQVSDEEKAQANKEYIEDHYSAGTIGDLKKSILDEYANLINDIVENESLKVKNSAIPTLDNERLDKTISNFSKFNITQEKDKYNYDTVAEKDRIAVASFLYNTRQAVLGDQLIELTQKSKYLVKDSAEYMANLKAIDDLNIDINTIKEALAIISERTLTIYNDEKSNSEGIQR